MARDLRSLWLGVLVLAHVIVALAACVLTVLLYLNVVGSYDAETGDAVLRVADGTTRNTVFLVAVALLVVDVLWLLYGRSPSAPLRHVTSKGPGGTVHVSREALEAGLRSAGESLDVVTRVRVGIERRGPKRLVVRAFFQAPDGVSILDAGRSLRRVLDERFAAMVGQWDGPKPDIEVEFVGFAGRLPRRPEPVPEPEPPAEEPSAFTGPKYPIPEDDVSEDERRA